MARPRKPCSAVALPAAWLYGYSRTVGSAFSIAQVQQYGGSMVADAGEDAALREAQAKFLAERAALKQTYEASTDPTFTSADETRDKKSVYVTIVAGLVGIAFLAPMLQFFYYTGGE